ncbi:MAG: metallophosphatase family protein [Polyangiaceae bacterium]|jgi:predicted phosphodiesterase|nr:metallophosphatase family protein [Polyangiaceae bacterium]
MRILCISDIHGHADALEQVLALGTMNGCTVVLVAGDLCFPGPEPLRTWKLLVAARAHLVQGVSDRALATLDPDALRPANDEERARVERMRACRKELGDVILARLARLPSTFRLATEDGGEVLVVHGSPADPMTPITHDQDDSEVSALLGDEAADVIVCGASHVPFERALPPVRIVGVGSVGEAPTPGLAHATVLETSPAGVDVRSLGVVLKSDRSLARGGDE